MRSSHLLVEMCVDIMVYLFIFSQSCVRLMHTVGVLYEGSEFCWFIIFGQLSKFCELLFL